LSQTNKIVYSKVVRILCSRYASDKEISLLQTASEHFQNIREIINIYQNRRGGNVSQKLSSIIVPSIVDTLERNATTLSDSLELAESIYWWAGMCYDTGLERKGKILLDKASNLLGNMAYCTGQEQIEKLKLCIKATTLLNKNNYTDNESYNRQNCCQELLNCFIGHVLSTTNLCSDIEIELAMLTFTMCIIENVENKYIVGPFQDMLKRFICQYWGDFHPYHISREVVYAYYLIVNGQSEEAIEILDKLLILVNDRLEDDAKIQLYNMLGFAYREQGNLDVSLSYYEKAVLKWRQYYTEDSSIYWNVVEEYAYALYYLGGSYLEKAFEVTTGLLNVIEQSLGKNNFEYLERLILKTSILHHVENISELKEVLQESETIAKQVCTNPRDLSKKLCYLSDEYCFLGDFAYAEELLKLNLLSLQENKNYTLGCSQNNYLLGNTYYLLGNIYRKGNKEEALKSYQNALNILKGNEEYTFAYLNVYSSYISVLYGMKCYEEVLIVQVSQVNSS